MSIFNRLSVVFIVAASLFVFCLSASAQTPVADYQVQGVLTSSVNSGIGPLISVGGAAPTYSATTVNGNPQQVLRIASSTDSPGVLSGVQTQTNPFVSGSTYSVVLLASFDLTTTGVLATKVFDFKNLSSDAGLYINTSTGNLQFINDAGILVGNGVPGTNITTNTYIQLALTRDNTGAVSVYETNIMGVTTLAFTFMDTTGLAIMGDATNTGNRFLTLYKDDAAGVIGGPTVNEGSQGNIARLRLYNSALSAAQIAALDTTVAVPEPSAGIFVIVGALLFLGSLAWRRATAR